MLQIFSFTNLFRGQRDDGGKPATGAIYGQNLSTDLSCLYLPGALAGDF